MKKIWLLAIFSTFLSLLSACGAQIEVKKVYWGDTTVLREQTRYVDDVAMGPHSSYYPSGQLKVQSAYLNNQLDALQ